jgi:hypothetical protein
MNRHGASRATAPSETFGDHQGTDETHLNISPKDILLGGLGALAAASLSTEMSGHMAVTSRGEG